MGAIMKMRLNLTAGTGFVLAGSCLFAGSVWPADANKQSQYAVAYQINPAHSGGITFSAGFATPLTKAWSENLGSSLSYPVIAGGRVFVNSSGGVTYALNLATGATDWSKNMGTSLGPAYDQGSLFVVTGGGLLSGLSARSGKTQWSVQLPYQYAFSSPPMAVKGEVFTGGAGSGGNVYGVDELTGNLLWTQQVANGDDSSPAYGNDGIYVSYPCQYYKFDPASGTVDWHYNGGCDGGGGNTPAYYSGRVYIQDWTSGNYVMDARDGTILGTFGANNGDPPAFYQLTTGKKLGFSLYNGQLYGWKVSSGTNVWNFSGDGQLSTPPIAVNGLVIEGSGSGNVYALDAASGTQQWTDNTGAGVTALAAGQDMLVVISGSIVTAYAPTQ
jgi:outer membrane protein assembly factor BamB